MRVGMPVPLVIGHDPVDLKVQITRGGQFSITFRSQDETGTPVPWPVGSTLRLEVSDGAGFTRSWPWTMNGADAWLMIPAGETASLPDGDLYARIWIDYGTGNGEFLWASGMVSIYG